MSERQRGEHESRDQTKKMTLVQQAKSKGASQASKESDGDQPRQQAAALPKTMSKGGFDTHPRLDEARLSYRGWQPLQPPTPLVGHKRTAVPSQSPKKTEAKVARQIQVQYRLSQQDLQPAPARSCLPLALMASRRTPVPAADPADCASTGCESVAPLWLPFALVTGMAPLRVCVLPAASAAAKAASPHDSVRPRPVSDARQIHLCPFLWSVQ